MYIQTQKSNQQANKLTIDCARHIFKHATKCKRETSKKITPLNSQGQNQKKTNKRKGKNQRKGKTYFDKIHINNPQVFAQTHTSGLNMSLVDLVSGDAKNFTQSKLPMEIF